MERMKRTDIHLIYRVLEKLLLSKKVSESASVEKVILIEQEEVSKYNNYNKLGKVVSDKDIRSYVGRELIGTQNTKEGTKPIYIVLEISHFEFMIKGTLTVRMIEGYALKVALFIDKRLGVIYMSIQLSGSESLQNKVINYFEGDLIELNDLLEKGWQVIC